MIHYKRREDSELLSCNGEGKSEISIFGLIMVKNQEENILKTLSSIESICDSIIVVDTGSTDNTVQAVRKHFPTVRIEFLKWEENYGKMRTQCLQFIPNQTWTLFIDSDEIFETPISYSEIHHFLNDLDFQYPDVDKVCTVKQRHHSRPAFFRSERFIKKTETLYYYGYVHEEPRSMLQRDLLLIDTDIEVLNLGFLQSELTRFDKDNRYCKLLQQNLVAEPDNPRWVSLITPVFLEKDYMSFEEYFTLLETNIFKQKKGDFALSNLKIGPYFSSSLERYCLECINLDKEELALHAIQLGKTLFATNSNFVVYEASLFLKQFEKDVSHRLSKIISFIKSTDSYLLHESSKGSEEALSGVVVKLLCLLSRYDEAKDVYMSISDELVKRMLTTEIVIFKESL